MIKDIVLLYLRIYCNFWYYWIKLWNCPLVKKKRPQFFTNRSWPRSNRVESRCNVDELSKFHIIHLQRFLQMFEYLRESLYIRFSLLEVFTVWRKRMNKIELLPSFQLQCSTVICKLFVSFARVCRPFDMFGFHLWSRGREPGILSSKTTLSFHPYPPYAFLTVFWKIRYP